MAKSVVHPLKNFFLRAAWEEGGRAVPLSLVSWVGGIKLLRTGLARFSLSPAIELTSHIVVLEEHGLTLQLQLTALSTLVALALSSALWGVTKSQLPQSLERGPAGADSGKGGGRKRRRRGGCPSLKVSLQRPQPFPALAVSLMPFLYFASQNKQDLKYSLKKIIAFLKVTLD